MTPNNSHLSGEQINTILDRIVPLIAAPEDAGFFRGTLGLALERMCSADAARFISKLLSEH